jgi:hypothetical protein
MKKKKQPRTRDLLRNQRKIVRVRKQQQRAQQKPRKKPAGPSPLRLLPALPVRDKARPANNTTCDIYYSPNVPPAAPDVAGIACTLIAHFEQGSATTEGDQTFRWTHILYVDATVDIRDSYPNAPVNRVYVPDKTATGFNVVFVELLNRGTPAMYKRVFLNRLSVTFPTNEL